MYKFEDYHISRILGTPTMGNLEMMKYPRFLLKENNYIKKYWQWFYAKV
jgi:hypothetical protein